MKFMFGYKDVLKRARSHQLLCQGQIWSLESVASPFCLIWNRSPISGNFQHWWTSNLEKPLRSEGQVLYRRHCLNPLTSFQKVPEWMSVSVNTLPDLLWLQVPWRPVGTLLTLSRTPSWGLLQGPCFSLTLPISCFHFISSSVFPLQTHTSRGWSENPD